jgi:hypothetical protein
MGVVRLGGVPGPVILANLPHAPVGLRVALAAITRQVEPRLTPASQPGRPGISDTFSVTHDSGVLAVDLSEESRYVIRARREATSGTREQLALRIGARFSGRGPCSTGSSLASTRVANHQVPRAPRCLVALVRIVRIPIMRWRGFGLGWRNT